MSRLALFALLAACSSAPRPISNTSVSPTRYALQPLRLHGGEGMHSASQSWTTISGALEVHGDKTTLALTLSTARGFIQCPDPDVANVTTMQACAPPGSKRIASSSELVLEGFSRWQNGALTITVRKDDTAATFTCREHGHSLECSYEDDYTLFGSVGQRPQRIVFDRV